MPDNEGVQAVSVSAEHACVLLRSGGVVCWGNGADARLGYGSFESLGGTLDTAVNKIGGVPLPYGTHAIGISTGDTFSCALLNSGNVVCWGDAREGRLGHDQFEVSSGYVLPAELPQVRLPEGRVAVAIAAGWRLTCAILDSSEVFCWGPNADEVGGNQEGFLVADIPEGVGIVSLSVGVYHMCAITEEAELLCWGSNS